MPAVTRVVSGSSPQSLATRQKKEASDALRQAILEAEARRNASPKTELPTFAAFFDRWMKDHAGRKCTAKTIERYEELGAYAMRQTVDLNGSPALFGEVTLDKFGPMHMELMVNALRDHGGQKTKTHPDGRPLSPKSVRHIASVVRGCFEKALRWQLIERNPMARVELPVVARKQPRVVEKDGAKKLLARARGMRLYPFLVLSLASGARRGELLALTWSDVDFESGIMSVTKSLSQTRAGLRIKSTKSGRPRKFAVPAIALDALREHRVQQDGDRAMFGADYQENQLVFCRPEGGHYNPCSMGNRVSALMKTVGLEGVSLHSLRHTHASELLSNGVPIPTVAKRLGHANANITMSIYAHAIEADELAAAKIWNDAMVDVIDANKPQPERMLANVSRRGSTKIEVIEKTG